MKRSNTINRRWLKTRIERGEVMAKCNYRYTDDYAGDAASNFGKTDWLPARIRDWSKKSFELPGGFIDFDESDFRGFGHCSGDKAGEMVLGFGYTSYSLRLATAEEKVAAKKAIETFEAENERLAA